MGHLLEGILLRNNSLNFPTADLLAVDVIHGPISPYEIASQLFRSIAYWISVLVFSLPVLLSFIASIPCLSLAIPLSKKGDWVNLSTISHRVSGVGTLILPLILFLYEAFTNTHPTMVLYFTTVFVCFSNVVSGAILVVKKIPAYDIPSLRGFAVSVATCLAFLGMSLMFQVGHHRAYRPIGLLFVFLSIYAVIYAWSDAIQHIRHFFKGTYKRHLGKWMGQNFTKTTWGLAFLKAIWKQPTEEELRATAAPSNIIIITPVFFIAVFCGATLVQLRYLISGPEGMLEIQELRPELARWAVYNSLLAVFSTNFATFLGSLVLHERISLLQSACYSLFSFLIPCINTIALVWRHPDIFKDLVLLVTCRPLLVTS